MLCSEWNVAILFPAYLVWEKIGSIRPFLAAFSHQLEQHSWCHRYCCLHKTACKKKIMLLVSQHGVIIYIYIYIYILDIYIYKNSLYMYIYPINYIYIYLSMYLSIIYICIYINIYIDTSLYIYIYIYI